MTRGLHDDACRQRYNPRLMLQDSQMLPRHTDANHAQSAWRYVVAIRVKSAFAVVVTAPYTPYEVPRQYVCINASTHSLAVAARQRAAG